MQVARPGESEVPSARLLRLVKFLASSIFSNGSSKNVGACLLAGDYRAAATVVGLGVVEDGVGEDRGAQQRLTVKVVV